jgi:hypothetical protein
MREPHAHTDSSRTRGNRGLLGLAGAIVLIVVVLLALSLRGCDTGATTTKTSNGNRTIVPVEGLTADSGVVSAWVQEGGNLSSVLKVAGLENSNITDMGGGRYVISVPVGTEDTVVRILAETDGVYAAGRVYSETK